MNCSRRRWVLSGGEALTRRLEGELARFADRITRWEVHLGDENAAGADRRCVLEARPVGRRPVSVTHHAGSVAEACHGAARKLYDLLDRVYDRAHHHKGGRTIRHREAEADEGWRGRRREPGGHNAPRRGTRPRGIRRPRGRKA
ncbi:HPF/RaiA family ribosome-associated protein [Amycolatopsis sp. NPDC049159]|uniref:HPF/RaiA family ribosome-associated protein n=1 Tax=Amycolatopsis sp. NPDC049159 TaxID=3157210 RepID=UPI0033C4883B